MDLGEIDLCSICSDLAKGAENASSPPSGCPPPPTYGSILSSSKTCAICKLIASLWPHSDSTLNKFGVSSETIQSHKDGFPVEIAMKAARRMHSGVSWTFWEATLRSTMTPLAFFSHFTLLTCPSEGKAVVSHLCSMFSHFV